MFRFYVDVSLFLLEIYPGVDSLGHRKHLATPVSLLEEFLEGSSDTGDYLYVNLFHVNKHEATEL